MDSTIICAIISGGITLTVCLINNKFQQDKTLQTFKDTYAKDIMDIKLIMAEVKAEYQQNIALLTERLDNLSIRVDKHNNVMEKVYDLQTLAVKYGEIQRNVDARLNDMEHDIERLRNVG